MTDQTVEAGTSTPGASASREGINWRIIFGRQEIGLLAVFLLWCAFLSLATDTFLTSTNVFNMLRAFSWIAIAAFGQCLVILTAGIDLSVGSNMAISGLAAALLLTAGAPVWVALVGGLLTGSIVGVINGLLVIRFRQPPFIATFLILSGVAAALLLLGGISILVAVVGGLVAGAILAVTISMLARSQLPPFIATLGTLSIARGITFGATQGWPVRGLPKAFNLIGQHDVPVGSWGVPVPFIIMAVLAVLVSLFLSRTVRGRHIYAVGGDEEASRLSGINPYWIKMLVYISCGLMAAIGGILMTARLGVAAPTAATGWELDIIAACVIGGVSLFGGEGTILGVLIGAAFMQTIRTGLNLLGVQVYWQPAAIGAVIILAVMFDQWRKGGGWRDLKIFTG